MALGAVSRAVGGASHGASQGTVAAVVAAALSAAAEPQCEEGVRTSLAEHLVKLPLFEALNAASAALLPPTSRGAVAGALASALAAQSTEASVARLDRSVLLQDALYGIARNKIYALVAALNPLRTRSSLGCFINILAAATAAHVLSTPGKEVLDYFLVPHGKRQPLLEFLQPARWFRDGAQHALLVGLSLAVGALATLQVEKLGTFLARQLWRRPRGLLAAGMVLVLCRLRLHSLHSLRMALLKSGTLESAGLPALLLSRAEARAEEKAVPAEEVSAEPSTQSDAEPTFPAPAGELEDMNRILDLPTFPAPAGELEEVPAEVSAEPSTQSDAEPTFPAPAGELEEVPAEVPAEPSTQSNAEPTSPAADKLEVQSAPPPEIPLETVDLAEAVPERSLPRYFSMVLSQPSSMPVTPHSEGHASVPLASNFPLSAPTTPTAPTYLPVYRSRAGLSYSSAVPVRGASYTVPAATRPIARHSLPVQPASATVMPHGSGPALPVLASNGNANISRPQTPAGRVETAVHPPHMSHVQVMHAQVRSVPMAPVYRSAGLPGTEHRQAIPPRVLLSSSAPHGAPGTPWAGMPSRPGQGRVEPTPATGAPLSQSWGVSTMQRHI